MSNELIKRIDEYLRHRNEHWADKPIMKLLTDCRTDMLATDLKLLSAQAKIQRLESELQKAREYVPMTRTEWNELIEQYSANEHNTPWRRFIEAEVIQRANLEVKP